MVVKFYFQFFLSAWLSSESLIVFLLCLEQLKISTRPWWVHLFSAIKISFEKLRVLRLMRLPLSAKSRAPRNTFIVDNWILCDCFNNTVQTTCVVLSTVCIQNRKRCTFTQWGKQSVHHCRSSSLSCVAIYRISLWEKLKPFLFRANLQVKFDSGAFVKLWIRCKWSMKDWGTENHRKRPDKIDC